jgi:hypothetical protein
MASHCRHVMPGGNQCHGYALQGQDLCFFHSRRRRADLKPVTCMDSIEIPLLEDRCVIQVTITQVLRAIVNQTIDRPRAQLLLYGLQLALQGVDRTGASIPFTTVKALSESSDGEELAAKPEVEYEVDDEDDDDEEEDSDDSSSGDDEDSDDDEDSEESGGDDSHSDDSDGEDDEDSEDGDEEDDDDSDDSEDGASEEEDDDEDDDGLDDESTDELISDAKYLQSVSDALNVGDTRQVAHLLKE